MPFGPFRGRLRYHIFVHDLFEFLHGHGIRRVGAADVAMIKSVGSAIDQADILRIPLKGGEFLLQP